MNVIVAPVIIMRKWDCDLEKEKQKELEEDKDKGRCGTRNSTTVDSSGGSGFLFHRRKEGNDEEDVAEGIAKDLMEHSPYSDRSSVATRCGCGMQTCRKKRGGFDVVELSCYFRKN
ncbi:unnamed protein product [Dracunculus medinensis]|uniref:Post-SET domain-containing protein n=1 Tax=Dracunculus medinensis TaxID=318479 RepID=A0A0N4UQL1_DRAME|nr:unnamed protein product [Dracunculus medinensis]